MYKFITALIIGIVIVVSFILIPKDTSSQKQYSVGIITLTEVDQMTINGFKDKLSELNYHEGDNIRYYYDGPIVNMEENFQKRVASLRKNHLDLIFVSSTPAAIAIKKEFGNSNIPILFCPVSDPVAAGLVESLKKPGANITGVKLVNGEDQRLKWFKELVPDLQSLYVPYTFEDKSAQASIEQIVPIAKKLGITLHLKGFTESQEDQTAIFTYAKGSDAIFMPRDSRMENHIDPFVHYTLEHKIPLSAPSFLQVEKGALFSYGHVHYELGKQAGRMAHQIFSGIPADKIPVELAENQFVLNVATANKIGLKLPEYSIKQADHVIKE